MSFWDWFWLVVGAALLAAQLGRLLGPFELEGAHAPDATRGDRLRTWFGGWLRRPRDPLTFSDWMPHAGEMFLPSLLTFGLLAGGAGVLARDGETFRLGGALAVLGGIVLACVIGGYVMRPVGEQPLPSLGGAFPTERGGYRADEVDAAFAALDSMTKADIKALQFHTARLGYSKAAVDAALDKAAEARFM